MDRETLINSYKIEDMLKNLEQRVEFFADVIFEELDRLEERLDIHEEKPTRRETGAKSLRIKHRIGTARPKRSQQ